MSAFSSHERPEFTPIEAWYLYEDWVKDSEDYGTPIPKNDQKIIELFFGFGNISSDQLDGHGEPEIARLGASSTVTAVHFSCSS